MDKEKSSSILYVATYPPRECGIATFTQDLSMAMDKKFYPKIRSRIMALNDDSTNIYNYPGKVALQIEDTNIHDYIDVAKKINEMDDIKLVSIQHEFGIFGGEYGSYLIAFLELIKKPVVITFHSVLPDPNDRIKKVVKAMDDRADCFVVMTKKAVEILREDYGVKSDITIIPHGIPSINFQKSLKTKTKLGYKDKILLTSFGMLNKGKGYEYVIEALPAVVKKFPNLLYVIVGETHPVVRKQEGEEYRNFLKEKVKELGLQKNVKFYNKYVTLTEIVTYLKASDIFMSTSLNPNQITSGTLVYAMGAGRAVISTPYLHAKDIINEERGVLVNFEDPKSYADAIIKLLEDPEKKDFLEKNTYSYTRHMTWPNVALKYEEIFSKYIDLSKKYEHNLPLVKLNHLQKMTDDFGLIQFANYSYPDIKSGYTLDDTSRAMIAMCMSYNQSADKSKLKLIKTYLNFIKYAQKDDGRFYNFIDQNRNINLSHWSDDPHGRALWALGYLINADNIPVGMRNDAEEIFKKGLDITQDIQSPRAVSFIISGLYYFNLAKPSEDIVSRIRKFADFLVSLYDHNSSDEWQWFETYLTYSNSKLSEALFYAYNVTKEARYLQVAESTLKFLISLTFEGEVFAPIGHDGWYFKDGKKAHFDQQPIDTGAMVQTLNFAYNVTGNEDYKNLSYNAFMWFLGKNSLNQVVYNESTGGCHDGIGSHAINLNQGAESTVSYLLARLSLGNSADM
ncbi:MAG: glycosyltransferase [Candidatus Woesearchaeota archaeon]